MAIAMTDIYPQKLNWRRIIQDLKEKGCSVYQAAKRIGKPETTVQSWAAGHEPSHSHGSALLKLHTQICGEEATKNRCTEESVYNPGE